MPTLQINNLRKWNERTEEEACLIIGAEIGAEIDAEAWCRN
jgi:hypothetical protein